MESRQNHRGIEGLTTSRARGRAANASDAGHPTVGAQFEAAFTRGVLDDGAGDFYVNRKIGE